MKQPTHESPTRTLVIGPAWIGDMVIANTLFQLIKSSYHTRLEVLAPEWTHPLLSRMKEVDAAISVPFSHGKLHLSKRIQLGRSLRSQYDWAITLPNSWKSALIPWIARIQKRTGYVGEQRWGLLNDIKRLNKKELPLMVQRYGALMDRTDMDDLPRPKLRVNLDHAKQIAAEFNLVLDRPVAALCPGSEYGPAKQWPTTHYGELAKYFLEHNYAIWLMGSDKDHSATSEIDALTGDRCENLAGRTDLAQGIDLLSLVEMVVCNDTGLMHIAAALDRPLVAIFGSTDSGHTPPLSPYAKVVQRNDLDCRPCFQRTCPLGHLDCLRGLHPSTVISVVDELSSGI